MTFLLFTIHGAQLTMRLGKANRATLSGVLTLFYHGQQILVLNASSCTFITSLQCKQSAMYQFEPPIVFLDPSLDSKQMHQNLATSKYILKTTVQKFEKHNQHLVRESESVRWERG